MPVPRYAIAPWAIYRSHRVHRNREKSLKKSIRRLKEGQNNDTAAAFTTRVSKAAMRTGRHGIRHSLREISQRKSKRRRSHGKGRKGRKRRGRKGHKKGKKGRKGKKRRKRRRGKKGHKGRKGRKRSRKGHKKGHKKSHSRRRRRRRRSHH